MYSIYFNIHGVGINFVSNCKDIFFAVKSELRHTVVVNPYYKKDKTLFFWNGHERSTPKPLRKLILNNATEVINSQIKSVVDYGNLNMAVLAEKNFKRDEAILACISLINYLVRFALYRRVKAVGFHAAGVSWKNKGVLLPGSSGAGKSTLCYYFVDSGFKFLSDEECLLQEAGPFARMLGLARCLRLDEGFFESEEGKGIRQRLKLAPYEAFGDKGYYLDLGLAYGRIYQRKVNLRIICLLANEEVAEPTLSLLDRSRAFELLLESFESVASYERASDPGDRLLQKYNATGFEMVEFLVDRYPVYQLHYNLECHGKRIPGLIKGLVSDLNQPEGSTENVVRRS